MFETDDDFDLEEAFLQDVFASECQPLKNNLDTNCTIKRTSPDINNFEHDINKKKQRFGVNKKESVQDESCGNNKKSKEIEAQQKNLIDVTSTDANSGQQRRHFDETPKSENVDAGLKRFIDSSGFANNAEQRDLASLGSTSIRIVAPIHTESLMQQRKFPGPAGLLPDRSCNFNKIVETASDSEDESVPSSQGPNCSQMFESPVWQRVVADFRLEPESPLGSCTVSWVKGEPWQDSCPVRRPLPCGGSGQYRLQLGGSLCNTSRHYRFYPGTLHREVRELFGGQLKPGCALVLRHVGVLGTRKSSRRHYLNITYNNIISIYYPCGDADLRVVRVQEVSLNELASSVHSVQSKRISENLSTVAVNSMLNSRDVNSICSVINGSTISANNTSIVPNTKPSSSSLFNSIPNHSSFKNINSHVKPNVLSQNTKNLVPIPHHVQSPQQFVKPALPVVNSMNLNDKITKLNNTHNNVNTLVSKQISSTSTGSSSPSATLSKGIGFRPKTSQLANLSSFSVKALEVDIKQPTCLNEMSNISARTSKISNSCSNSILAVPNNSTLNKDTTDENSIVHTVLGCIDTQLLFEDFLTIFVAVAYFFSNFYGNILKDG